MFSTLTKLHLKTLSVFVFVAFLNPVLHQAQKEDLRKYQQMPKHTVNYCVFCNAAANQVDTEHLQINLFHAKRKKVGPGGGGGDHILCIYTHVTTHAWLHLSLARSRLAAAGVKADVGQGLGARAVKG